MITYINRGLTALVFQSLASAADSMEPAVRTCFGICLKKEKVPLVPSHRIKKKSTNYVILSDL